MRPHSEQAGDKYVWGNGEKISHGTGGTNAKPNGSIDILQAWILYSGQGLFGFNSGLKVGHMPLKLAYGQFFDNTQYGDDALVLFMSPVKGLEMAALTFKFNECVTGGNCRFDNTDDLDAYVGLMTYKWNETNTVGINYTYLNESDLELQMDNLGLHADGTFGAFGYKVAADIQFGSVVGITKLTSVVGLSAAAANYDFSFHECSS